MLPAPTHLFALLTAAVVVVAALRAAHRWRPIDPAPAGAKMPIMALVVATATSAMLAVVADVAPWPALARNILLLAASVLAVLTASHWAERQSSLLGIRQRLQSRDVPALAALCTMLGVGALAMLEGRPPLATALIAGAAGLLAGLLPSVHAAVRLRAGRDGGGVGTLAVFVAVIVVALCGALPYVR